MKKHCAEILTALAALCIVAASVALSLHISQQQSVVFHTKKAQAMAAEVARRTDEIGAQVSAAVGVLSVYQPSNFCSAQEIAVMRKLQISASYLQGIGRVRNGKLVCSSHGNHDAGYELGPVDFASALGASVRTSTVLPLAPHTPFIILELDGFAAVVHPALMFDVSDYGDDVALAVLNTSSGKTVASRGAYSSKRVAAQTNANTVNREADGSISARQRSERFDLTTVAIIAPHAIKARADAMKIWLVPVGFGIGMLLSWGLLLLLRRQVSITTMMRAALRRGEFYVEYQPVIRLEDRQCIGAEALLRWRRPDGTLVRPDLFIPIAEESGLIRAISRRMLSLVDADLPALLQRMPHLHLSVNLSPQDMDSDELVGQLAAMRERTGIEPGKLVVEATERGLMDVNLATTVIQEIQKAGIGVAIDDFGTGYSCLSYLTTLNVDYLKIDKSFVDTIGTAAPTNSVVPHIIAMARSLDLGIIAEGVETEAQAAFLRERGVQFAQGWLFAKSMPAADFQRYLTAHAAVRHSGVDALDSAAA